MSHSSREERTRKERDELREMVVSIIKQLNDVPFIGRGQIDTNGMGNQQLSNIAANLISQLAKLCLSFVFNSFLVWHVYHCNLQLTKTI